MSTGERLKRLREHFHISQIELAKTLKASQGVVSDIERGEKDISRNLLQKLIIRYPDVNLNWLLSGKGSMIFSLPTLGDRLVKVRHDREISPESMANFASISLEEYQAYERNEREPPKEVLKKWEKILNLSKDWVSHGIGEMYTEPEQTKEIKMITIEGEGETSWQQQFPGVFRMYQENKRLKDRVNGSGCSVCKIMRSLDTGRQNRVTGYAEALLQEQQQETDSDTEK